MHQRKLRLLIVALTAAALTQTAIFAAQLPELNWSKRSDWINVKTDVTPAAVGDGVTDDTAAIQAALSTTGTGLTVYFPPGKYKVTRTLMLTGGNSHFAINLVGHGRATTLAWYGAAGSNFFTINGNPYSRYEGLILDGRDLAASGFHVYNTLKFETSIRFKHIGLYHFTGNAVNAVAGDSYAMAETSYENCIFDHCAVGMLMGGFNDYNHTFTGCDFISCGIGINCNHGNFFARDCFFSGSKAQDIYALPEHGCSVRRCKSVGSAQFIFQHNGVAPLSVQDCYVEGWTGGNGAIQYQYRPALLLTHSRFVNPPDKAPPVRCAGKVLLCDNAAPSSSAVASGSKLYAIPAGTYAPRVGSTNGASIASFINPNVAVPSVVFDAKVNYGAVGDGQADDTAAIQKTIDAARKAGDGAIAYIPRGNYKITSTLAITGNNYVVGGCGYFARLVWAGAAGGAMVAVTDPNNVRLENIMIGHHDSGAMSNGSDIVQTSVSGSASKMTYDGVYVYGKYQRAPDTKGLCLNGLGSNSVVVLNMIEGNVRLSNSAAATVIGNVTYEGTVVVDGASAARTGFLGFMTRLSTITTYGFIVRNNNNFIISDYYTEQGDNGFLFSGEAGNPSGRITIQGVNTGYTPADAVMMTINDYEGKILFGSEQVYVDPPVKKIIQRGTRPLDIVLYGSLWYNASLSFTGTTAVVYALGNQAAATGVAPADTDNPQTLADISLAMDDLQRLGNLDLDINFPFMFPKEPVSRKK